MNLVEDMKVMEPTYSEIEGGRCQDENIEEGDICKFLTKI